MSIENIQSGHLTGSADSTNIVSRELEENLMTYCRNNEQIQHMIGSIG